MTVRPQDRWREYTIDQLESHAESLSRGVAGAMLLVLAFGALAVVILFALGRPFIAIGVAVLAVGVALVPPARALAYQVKMGVGALGMLVEEVRALHVRLELSPTGSSDTSDDDEFDWDEDELDWDEDDSAQSGPSEYGDRSGTTEPRSTQM